MAGGKRMLCTYWPKPGQEEAMRAMLLKHGPALKSGGLLGDEPVRIWKATDRSGRTRFVERFDWRDETSSDTAHQLPEVMAVWEPMGELCDDMDFSVVEPIGDHA